MFLTNINVKSLPGYSFDWKEFLLGNIAPVLISSLFIYTITRRGEKKDYRRRSTESILSDLNSTISKLASAESKFINYATLLKPLEIEEDSNVRIITDNDVFVLLSALNSFERSLQSLYIVYTRSFMIGIDKNTQHYFVDIYNYFDKMNNILRNFLDEVVEHLGSGFIPENSIKNMRKKHQELKNEFFFPIKYQNLIGMLSQPFIKIGLLSKIKVKRQVRKIMKTLNE